MSERAALEQLAAQLGVETSYWSFRGEPQVASSEAILAILAAIGRPLRSIGDAEAALADHQREVWAETVPPVVIGWDAALAVPLSVDAALDAEWELTVGTERGTATRRRGRLFDLPATDHRWPGGRVHCKRWIHLDVGELGYHQLEWRVGQRWGRAQVIAAPTRGYGAPGTLPRRWGVFAPLYGLRTPRSGGTGDLGTLGALRAKVSAMGGAYVATLPLLAAFLDQPFEPSPYAPASRLFWNELYLDLDDAPGLDGSSSARRLLADPEILAERARLAATAEVDYRAQYRWRREVIDALAASAWRGALAPELLAFATGRALDYAMFRAIGETEGRPWSAWPAALRDGAPRPERLADAERLGADPARTRAHLYAQWAMDRQLAAHEAHGEAGLYLDLPVGVNSDAYEVWRDRQLFALGASTGAPPDALFLGGQDWGLPPIIPEASRKSGHRYFIESVRHHVRHAAMLRIDHVMGLSRLYWVPRGFSAKEGVYVRYPADELYAVLALESSRHQCALVGEDLGTVPDEVRPTMASHGMYRLFVGQFAMPGKVGEAPAAAYPDSVASLNTHDTATFAGWWQGQDIDDRRALNLIDDEQMSQERADRAAARQAVLAFATADHRPPTGHPPTSEAEQALGAVLTSLSEGPADVVLLSLEDLWLEANPQNVPGTSTERPNWRRPLRFSVDKAMKSLGDAAPLLARTRSPGK